MRLVRYTYPSVRNVAPAFGGLPRARWLGLDQEIDRLFESALSDLASPSPTRCPVDLYEDKDHTYVRAELPGVNRDDISVEMTDGYLTITATRKPAADGKGEQAAFSFHRAVSIAGDVQTDQVTATYENGVLTVTLPKREAAKPKKIAVAVK